MSLEEKMKTGELYWESGNLAKADQYYEKIIEEQRTNCKEVVFDFNQTRPSNSTRKTHLLGELLRSVGEGIWMESPIHFAYGVNTSIGNHFYANFNLVVVDDGPVKIGNNVMIGPNVTITTTGHPIHPDYRQGGGQFSLPVVIEDGVWIGANVVIMPGVTVGENTVIGAGSVVTRDIPANVVAFGSPCRVNRPIGQRDKDFYHQNRKIKPEHLR
ncbi:sugar O-acetyltransferase [uncultured Vagococcus sp.]|uniref:sugar O-acetyltransferase n=1 Tax=uncultured Vagococcus sp. TaxID=189676 RepID=UPI0028D63497|nr:sugar O-acetyltransferase [uncultured Vagococcus sp.]